MSEFQRTYLVVLPEVDEGLVKEFYETIKRDAGFLPSTGGWLKQRQPDLNEFMEGFIDSQRPTETEAQLMRDTYYVMYGLLESGAKGYMPQVDLETLEDIKTAVESSGGYFETDTFEVLEQAQPHVDRFMPQFIAERDRAMNDGQQTPAIMLMFHTMALTYRVLEGQAIKLQAPSLFSQN